VDGIPLPHEFSGGTRDSSADLALNDSLMLCFACAVGSRIDSGAAVEQPMFGVRNRRTVHAWSQEYIYLSLGTRDTTT
jgi:hypothetical protein